MIDLSKYIVHDLTLSYSDKIAGFSQNPAKVLKKDGWNATSLTIYSHAGTHMDAPFHFEVSDQTIDEYAPASFMGKTWIVKIDIKQPNQLLFVHDLGKVANDFRKGENLILQTNWSKKLGERDYRDGLPRISKELAEWCVEKKVNILGVEPPSVADVNNLAEVTEIHEILLGGKVIIVEGLTNLTSIKKNTVFLMAFPLKIERCDGAPARVIALEEK